jgi:protein-L-isoaspartate(D-aspartate) O-methyltransferase
VLPVVLLVIAGCQGETVTTLPPITAVAPTSTPSTTTPTTTTTKPLSTTATDPPVIVAVDDRVEERTNMVEFQLFGRGVTDGLVVEAMLDVPRDRFVPAGLADLAYGDHPLPIGHGQTISQPIIVAVMSAALDLTPGDKVLEIGTGSGYQAAVLAAMGMEVYSVEIIPELAAGAQEILDKLGYEVAVRTGDGYFGWEEQAPFDAIIVTAAPDHVPQPLVDQLGPGAALVIPVGPVGAVQTLWRFTVDDTGELLGESLGDVAFVPFTRAEEG